MYGIYEHFPQKVVRLIRKLRIEDFALLARPAHFDSRAEWGSVRVLPRAELARDLLARGYPDHAAILGTRLPVGYCWLVIDPLYPDTPPGHMAEYLQLLPIRDPRGRS